MQPLNQKTTWFPITLTHKTLSFISFFLLLCLFSLLLTLYSTFFLLFCVAMNPLLFIGFWLRYSCFLKKIYPSLCEVPFLYHYLSFVIPKFSYNIVLEISHCQLFFMNILFWNLDIEGSGYDIFSQVKTSSLSGPRPDGLASFWKHTRISSTPTSTK